MGDEVPEIDGVPDDAVWSPNDDSPVGGHDSEASPEKDFRVDLEYGSRDLEGDAEELRGDRRRRTNEQDGEGTPEGDDPVPRMPGEPT